MRRAEWGLVAAGKDGILGDEPMLAAAIIRHRWVSLVKFPQKPKEQCQCQCYLRMMIGMRDEGDLDGFSIQTNIMKPFPV